MARGILFRASWMFPLIGLLFLAACSGDRGTGPVDVKWDRDACGRCNMVLSDRMHSAQVRYSDAHGRSRVQKFDDVGCAVLWLDQQPWAQDPGVEIWVADHRNGDWIDARHAFYIGGQLTPMEYGLGAQPESAPGALDFAQARTHIYAVEERYNTHGAHLQQNAEQPRLPNIQPPGQ